MDLTESTFCILITYILHIIPYSPVVLDSKPLSLKMPVRSMSVFSLGSSCIDGSLLELISSPQWLFLQSIIIIILLLAD